MAYTTPKTWATGEVVTAANLNLHLRDNVSFLANPPACRVYNNAAISIPNATETLLTFNSERWDTASMHSTASLTSRITMPVAGLYLLTATFEFQSNATGIRYFYFRHNGTLSIGYHSKPSTQGARHFTVSTVYKFAAADWIEMLVFQDSGGALNVIQANNFSPEFGATWIGIG
jgi:hypothetical protein